MGGAVLGLNLSLSLVGQREELDGKKPPET